MPTWSLLLLPQLPRGSVLSTLTCPRSPSTCPRPLSRNTTPATRSSNVMSPELRSPSSSRLGMQVRRLAHTSPTLGLPRQSPLCRRLHHRRIPRSVRQRLLKRISGASLMRRRQARTSAAGTSAIHIPSIILVAYVDRQGRLAPTLALYKGRGRRHLSLRCNSGSRHVPHPIPTLCIAGFGRAVHKRPFAARDGNRNTNCSGSTTIGTPQMIHITFSTPPTNIRTAPDARTSSRWWHPTPSPRRRLQGHHNGNQRLRQPGWCF
mgnify:CR=1 FL=1